MRTQKSKFCIIRNCQIQVVIFYYPSVNIKLLNEDIFKLQNTNKSISIEKPFSLTLLHMITSFPFSKGSESPMMIGELRSDLDDVDP